MPTEDLNSNLKLAYYRAELIEASALDCRKQRQEVYRLINTAIIKEENNFPINPTQQQRALSQLVKNDTVHLLEVIADTDVHSAYTTERKLGEIDGWMVNCEALSVGFLLRDYSLNPRYIAHALKLIVLTQQLNEEVKDIRLFAARKKVHQTLCDLYNRLFLESHVAVEDAEAIFNYSVILIRELFAPKPDLDDQLIMLQAYPSKTSHATAILQAYVAKIPHATSTHLRRVVVALVMAALSFLLIAALQMHFSGIGLVAALTLVKLTTTGLPQSIALVNTVAPPVLGLLSLIIPFACRYYSDKIPNFANAVSFFSEQQKQLKAEEAESKQKIGMTEETKEDFVVPCVDHS